MLTDLRRSGGGAALDCDVCVIGAGAAGLAIGRELAGSGLRTVLLEGGADALEPAAQSLYEAEVSGTTFVGHMTGRFRVFGGSTTQWGGQALPLTLEDFRARPWIANSGWPLSADTLDPYYRRAGEFLGLDGYDYASSLAAHLGASLPAFDPRLLVPYFSKWSARPNLAEVYGPRLRGAGDVRIVLNANVTALELDDGGSVERVRARSLEGQSIEVTSRFVVLACGGLEVARLLLVNREKRPNGIGNEYDLVGRFLQDHPGGPVGVLVPANERAVQRRFNAFHEHGRKYTVRFAAAPELQRVNETASASGTLMFVADERSPFQAAKAIYRGLRSGRLDGKVASQVGDALIGLPQLGRSLYEFSRGRVYTPNPVVKLIVSCEQEPDPASRVTLSTSRDALGTPRLNIHWRVSERTRHAAQVFARAAKAQLAALGVGEVHLDAWLFDPDADWRSHLGDHNHHMGTARMSASPRTGVVDADCRVHGTNNLFVASSAVFPTSGHSNPTLTIIALAVRLADRLRALAANRGMVPTLAER